jgi:ribosomal-protein-alanine acetyltransferase
VTPPAFPREATAADADAVVALEQRCFPDEPWTQGMVAEELARPGGVFVVEGPRGAPTAYAMGWSVLGELHVLRVAVDPALRRSGAGTRLMTALERGAPGAETAWLEVREDNTAAIRLYEATGYTAVGRRPRYYADGCAALLFRKQLR